MQEDILAFKTYHILPDDFGKVIAVEKKITNLSSANIIYTIQYGDIVNEICVLDRSDNKVSYQIKQGNIQNFLTISGNELEVDGHRIVLPSDSKMKLSSIMPLSSDRSYQLVCPYGVASDYSKSAGSGEKADITLGTPVKDLVLSVFLSIICGLVNPVMGGCVGVAGSALYNWLKDDYPYAEGLSYKENKYYHKSCGALSGGHISGYNNNTAVTKHSITWYSEKDFKGSTKASTVYELYTIY